MAPGAHGVRDGTVPVVTTCGLGDVGLGVGDVLTVQHNPCISTVLRGSCE